MAISSASCAHRHTRGICKSSVGSAIGVFLLGYADLVLSQTGMIGTGPAVPFRVQTSVSGSATYSDNINLAPSGQERSDLVMGVNPVLAVERNGPRLRLKVSYRPELLFYTSGTNGTSIRNTLNASGTAEIVQELVYFDALANISQQNISPYGALAAESVNGSSNRVEARSFSFGPYIRSRFGQTGTYQLGYRHSLTTFNNDALARSQADEIYGSVNGNSGLRDLTWGVNVDRQDTNYAESRSQRFEHASATLTYRAESSFSIHATSGFDRASYSTFAGEKAKGSYYSAGFDWVPNPTTNLSAEHGHRYFGSTDLVQFTHRSPHAVWRLGYTKDRTTSAQLLGAPIDGSTFALLDSLPALVSRYPDSAVRSQVIIGLLQNGTFANEGLPQFNFVSNQVFLQRNLNASVALIGKRNTLTFALNSSEQTALSDDGSSSDIFATSRTFRQSGASVSWNYTLGERTNAIFSAQRQKSEAVGASDRTTQKLVSATIERRVQRNLRTSLSVHHVQQDGTVSNYKENGIVATAQLQF